MTTASRPSREALGLQLSELSNAVDAETDLDYAYRLQLEEALEASLRSQPGHEHLAPHLPPAEEQPSQTARALQLQGATWRAQQTLEADLEHAQLLNKQDRTQLAQELRDRRLAQTIRSCPEERWEEEGDLLELPQHQEASHLDLSTSMMTLLVASRVRHSRAGYAVRLTSNQDQQIWTGTGQTHLQNNHQMYPLAKAHLQGVLLGIHVAASLGVKHIKFNIPTPELLRQVQHRWLPCGTDISPDLDELAEMTQSFSSVEPYLQDLKPGNQLMRSAWQCCTAPQTVPQVNQQQRLSADQANQATPIHEDCAICLESISPELMHVIGTCLHHFCTSCLSGYLKDRVAGRAFPMTCPQPGCDACISMPECKLLLQSPEAVAKLTELEAEHAIPPDQKFYCPHAECSALMVVTRAEPGQENPCTACRRALCFFCRTTAHPGFSCGEVKAGHSDDSLVLRLADQRRWRQCRNCRQLVALESGCNHITCRCGAHFCYRCGAPWQTKCTQGCELWDEDMLLAEEDRVRQHNAAARPAMPVPQPAQPAHPAHPRHRNRFYKTKMCRDWISRGDCWREDGCQFAHGWDELRPHPYEVAQEHFDEADLGLGPGPYM